MWQTLTDMRAEYYGERFHNDTTRRGGLLLKEYLENGWVHQPTEHSSITSNKTISINGDGSQGSEGKFEVDDESNFRNPEYLLKLHNYDPSKWELVNSKNSFWDNQVKGGKIQKLYSSKVTVRPKSGLDLTNVTSYFDEFSKIYVPTKIEPKQYEFGAECLVPCLFDVHFSKLAAYEECGEKYDFKIAKQRVLDSIRAYISRFANRTFEKIIFVIGNDYFNSEATGETVNNTRQDNDTRYNKMFNMGTETLIEAIDMLSSVAPVDVVLVQGNHAFYAEFYAACVLKAWYKNSDTVTVDSTARTRKYRKFGDNLLGFTHGSEEKDRLYGLMQVEVAEDWGRCKGSKEWLVGHLHSEGVTEKNGVVVRRIPSLTGLDAWHLKSGFVTAKKRTMAFIYDKKTGLTETHYVNI